MKNVDSYYDLTPHIGHDVQCVAFGGLKFPDAVSLRCVTCRTNLLLYKKPRVVQQRIVAYTDGACDPNPGEGGWGVVITLDGEIEEALQGGDPDTTNQRMELTAAIEATRYISKSYDDIEETDVLVVTDSEYVKNGITKWILGWKRNGWKTSAGKPVKNQELWRELDELTSKFRDVSWSWVKSHAGNPMNEYADRLAREGYRPF